MDRIPRPGPLLLTCSGLLALFAILSWRGFVHESPTVDEPLHAVSAYRAAFDRDFLMNTEDPPLWKYWMNLPHHPGQLDRAEDASEVDPTFGGFTIATRQLFQSPGIDGAEFVQRSRYMMLIIGIALGAMLMRWSHQIAGPVAGMVAGLLYCFDPSFLGHAPLLKNDVAISLVFLGVVWSTWRVGRGGSWIDLTVLPGLSALCATVKFSGLLLVPIVMILLLIRALRSEPWKIAKWELTTRASRVIATMIMLLAGSIIAYCSIWAVYGFRFAAAPGSQHSLHFDTEIRQVALNRQLAGISSEPREGLPERIIRFSYDHKLFPESWLFGLLHTYGASLVRESYLLGQVSMTGWWYYFPLAILFKSPLATLAMLMIALAVFLRERKSVDRWSALCVIVPVGIYMLTAMTSNLNLGIRHLLPIYPLVFISIGVAIAKLRKLVSAKPFYIGMGALAFLLGIECLSARSHYISFFNIASRGQRLGLLSDSNFDWGQDLPAVANWQRQNSNVTLYLGYWGPADPRFYRIQYTNIPGGFAMGHAAESSDDLHEPGVLMISATLLQGVNFPPQTRDFYADLRNRIPDQLIGDTIYLYRWPLR